MTARVAAVALAGGCRQRLRRTLRRSLPAAAGDSLAECPACRCFRANAIPAVEISAIHPGGWEIDSNGAPPLPLPFREGSGEGSIRTRPIELPHRLLRALRVSVVILMKRYKFPANTPTSTPKYAASFRIICRLNGFFPASTSRSSTSESPSSDAPPTGSPLSPP